MAWQRAWQGRYASTSRVLVPGPAARALLGLIWCCLGEAFAARAPLTLCVWRPRTLRRGRRSGTISSRTCLLAGTPVLWVARSCSSTTQHLPTDTSGCASGGAGGSRADRCPGGGWSTSKNTARHGTARHRPAPPGTYSDPGGRACSTTRTLPRPAGVTWTRRESVAVLAAGASMTVTATRRSGRAAVRDDPGRCWLLASSQRGSMDLEPARLEKPPAGEPVAPSRVMRPDPGSAGASISAPMARVGARDSWASCASWCPVARRAASRPSGDPDSSESVWSVLDP